MCVLYDQHINRLIGFIQIGYRSFLENLSSRHDFVKIGTVKVVLSFGGT